MFLVRVAAQAAWKRVWRSQRFPGLILPLLRLPADSLLPGETFRPGGEMAAGREDAHADADLSHDHFRVAAADAGDRLEQRQRRRERDDLLLDPC